MTKIGDFVSPGSAGAQPPNTAPAPVGADSYSHALGQVIADGVGLNAPVAVQGPGNPAQGPTGGGRSVADQRLGGAMARSLAVAARAAATHAGYNSCVLNPPASPPISSGPSGKVTHESGPVRGVMKPSQRGRR
jgi:hypothetical protein